MRSHRSFLGVAGLLLAASLTVAGAARAGSVEVKLTLPVHTEYDHGVVVAHPSRQDIEQVPCDRVRGVDQGPYNRFGDGKKAR